jgi:type I restriction enzyme S subunit
MKYQTIELKSISTKITKGTTPSNIGEGFTQSGINYIRSEMITHNKYIDKSKLLYISNAVHEKLKRSQLESGDILFSMAGIYLGKTAVLREEDIPANTNQAVALIRLNNDLCNIDFIYYFLNQPKVLKYVNQISGQSAQPNINLQQIGSIPINLPDMKIQRRIADILSAYDDLIENTQKQIKLLEEAAMRLYKEWFVKLRFPGHENTKIVDGVPEGWEVNRADSFFDITIGKTPPRAESHWFVSGKEGIPWVSISDMGKNGAFIFQTAEGLTEQAVYKHNVNVVPIDTIILSFKLTVGRVAITTSEITTNEAIAHFKTDNPLLREYVFLYLKNFSYETLGSTSAISTAINSKIVKAMPFVMPSTEIIHGFSSVVKPLLDKIYGLQDITLKAMQARDKLLPKLMTGEIEV